MKTGTKNLNLNLLLFLILVLFSEVVLVYTTYRLIKKSDTNCLTDCSKNEIWEVINNEKFLNVIKKEVKESLLEIKSEQENFLTSKKNPDWNIIRTRRDYTEVTHSDRRNFEVVDQSSTKTSTYGFYVRSQPTNSPGPPGPPGPTGPPGLPGRFGLPGRDGLKGFPGMPGFIGPKGDKGSQGYPGIAGAKGEIGLTGLPGDKGSEGLLGLPGIAGEIGLPGLQGLIGIKGDKGSEGYAGFPGVAGPKGETGMPGLKGDQGFPGIEGLPGLPGRTGLKGEPGVPGEPGKSGLPGPMGPPGPKGHCETENPDKELKIKINKYGNEVYPVKFPKKIENIINKIANVSINKKYKNRIAMSELLLEKNISLLWEAGDADTFALLEYYDIESFFNKNPYRAHDLYLNFDESNKVIYDRNFYYKSAVGRPAIIKYSLETNTVQALMGIPGLTTNNISPLYKSTTAYFDFNVDENGLWLIFAVPHSNNTGVLKINTQKMAIENAWNITLDHTQFNEMFIASGKLYTIKFSENLKIATALDLYKKEYYIMDLELKKGPTISNIKVWYEYKNKKLYVAAAKSKPLQYEYSILFEDTNLTKFRKIKLIDVLCEDSFS